jgi:hypothetical protein
VAPEPPAPVEPVPAAPQTIHPAPAEEIGGVDQVVIASDFLVGFNRSDKAGTPTDLDLMPAIDYFISPALSIGGQVRLSHYSVGSNSTTHVGLGPRVGYYMPLHPMFSVFPRVGLSFDHVSAGKSHNLLTFFVYAPFMFHPVPHFFVGLGPSLSADIAGADSNTRTAQFGLKTTVGGWFDW